MPTQAERRRARNKGKPNVPQVRKQQSSRDTWKFLAFGLLVAVASAGYYLYGARQLNTPELQNVEEDPMVGKRDIFNVVDIPGKGKGAIAARDIKQGELLLQERPLFTVPRNVNSSPAQLIAEKLVKLDPDEREEFFELSYVNFPEDLKPEEHPNEVALSIFQTNAVSAGEDVGIFTTMARLNHGCSSAFNVVYSWRSEGSYLVVYALKDIKQGQELLTTYTNTKKPRNQRRTFLSEQYGFHCTCNVCALPDEESKASDGRLSEISLLYEQFATWGKNEIEGADAIEIIRTIWRVEDEEGYWSERGSLAADAAWIAASHSDAMATQSWARKAVEWFTIEIGADTPQVRTLMTIMDRPESHKAWGTRDAVAVGGPEEGAH
ncbi:hypothetical protein GALMADRAFT_238083 [Galerina marginata CBS 339.88]|uniref:SET domain-containing protein n=1 Tax=Galerina marginata (strain CBS 339.88) TaxID=685588 RepID=A0A067THE4_GALM3|nr:hypothetical protein GALMADRAFT_238083 [Galerina marginata CBS 339.88]